ncbi:hypothetical protein C8Q79DRAFT_21333 [Trametes meyenii]|nr:hypothetical protein C8Q79DRAFT_21333 [Trametes meyenii]
MRQNREGRWSHLKRNDPFKTTTLPGRLPQSRLPGLAHGDPALPRKRRKGITNELPSHDPTLAKPSKLSKRGTKSDDHPDEQDAGSDPEEHPPEPPRKKHKPPEDDRISVPIETQPDKRARRPPPPDTPMRKASRRKAPPVLAPKGTKLKPKPRPRLSMFPAPLSNGNDTDRDPIDFLS